MNATETESNPNDAQPKEAVDKRVIKQAGGRHLVFRINRGPWWFLPKPYAMISNIEGSLLLFYGMGQLWATHRKQRIINDWIVRVPRLISKRIVGIVDELEKEIAEFVEKIDELGVIGTIMIERHVIEFHWTVPRQQRNDPRTDLHSTVDREFNRLAKAYAELQLVGQEGQHDVNRQQIELKD